MHLCTITRYEYESDPRSYEYYLGSSSSSSVIKVWKEKFRPVWDLNPWPLRYRCSTLQPAQAWFFFRPYFYYYLSSVHNCEGRLHIRFFSRSSHIWFSISICFTYFGRKVILINLLKNIPCLHNMTFLRAKKGNIRSLCNPVYTGFLVYEGLRAKT